MGFAPGFDDRHSCDRREIQAQDIAEPKNAAKSHRKRTYRGKVERCCR